MTTRQDILTPVGRLVGGSLYTGSDKDADGKQRVIKTGPNAGQPTTQFYFKLAIPKRGEQHWATTEWGAKIWAAGHAAFPVQAQTPHFSWKVVDGDSQVPNRNGNKPCDNEGYPGNWVLTFSSGFAPKVFNADGTQQITEVDAVKPGYFVQVFGSVDGNGSTQQPGVFLNHSMVAFAGYGAEIQFGLNAAAVGFGAGVALPAGASAVPLSGGFNPAPPVPGAAPAPTSTPPVPPAPAASMPAPPTAPSSPPPVAVAPNPAFLAPPAPPAAAAPVAPPARVMTPAATTTYDAYRAAGWTDAQLIQNGLMQP